MSQGGAQHRAEGNGTPGERTTGGETPSVSTLMVVQEEDLFLDVLQHFAASRYLPLFADDVASGQNLQKLHKPRLVVAPVDVEAIGDLRQLLVKARGDGAKILCLGAQRPELKPVADRFVDTTDNAVVVEAASELLGERRSMPRAAFDIPLQVANVGQVQATAISARSLFVPTNTPLESGQRVQIAIDSGGSGTLRSWARVVRVGPGESGEPGMVLGIPPQGKEVRTYLDGLVRGLLLLDHAEQASQAANVLLPDQVSHRLAMRAQREVAALRATLQAQMRNTDALTERLDAITDKAAKEVKWNDVRPLLAKKLSAQRELVKSILQRVEALAQGQAAVDELRDALEDQHALLQRVEQQDSLIGELRSRLDRLEGAAPGQGATPGQGAAAAEGGPRPVLAATGPAATAAAVDLPEEAAQELLRQAAQLDAAEEETNRLERPTEEYQPVGRAEGQDPTFDTSDLGAEEPDQEALTRPSYDEPEEALTRPSFDEPPAEEPEEQTRPIDEDLLTSAARDQDDDTVEMAPREVQIPSRLRAPSGEFDPTATTRPVPEHLLQAPFPDAGGQQGEVAEQDEVEDTADVTNPTDMLGSLKPGEWAPIPTINPPAGAQQPTAQPLDAVPTAEGTPNAKQTGATAAQGPLAAAQTASVPRLEAQPAEQRRLMPWIIAAVVLTALTVTAVLVLPSLLSSDKPTTQQALKVATNQPADARAAATIEPDASSPAATGGQAADAAPAEDRGAALGDAGASPDAEPPAAKGQHRLGARARRRAAARRRRARRRYLLRRAAQQIRKGQHAAARASLTAALKMRDEHHVRWLLARSHMRAGETWPAIYHLKKCLASSPAALKPARHVSLARLYFKVGKKLLGCKEVAQALRGRPGYKPAAALKKARCM